MRNLFAMIGLLIFVSAFTLPTSTPWLTDMDQAKAKAAKEDKFILMSFQGSDWCANCMRLEKDLFENSAFDGFAKDNLVLLKLDFPARKKNQLPAEQKAHNEKLAEKYNKSGSFPMVLILDSDGKVVGKMKHPSKSVNEYLSSLRKITNR